MPKVGIGTNRLEKRPRLTRLRHPMQYHHARLRISLRRGQCIGQTPVLIALDVRCLLGRSLVVDPELVRRQLVEPRHPVSIVMCRGEQSEQSASALLLGVELLLLFPQVLGSICPHMEPRPQAEADRGDPDSGDPQPRDVERLTNTT